MSIQKSRINIINNPNKSFTQASFIESNKQQSERVGQLFILSEINKPDKNAEKIIFIISQLLEKNYYLNEKLFLSENINSFKLESIFESALVKSNRELLEFMDQEKLVFDFKSLNIIAGIVYENQIHFSSMGLNKSYLIKEAEKTYQISDINPDVGEHETEELSSGKIFSSIISGEIPEKSYIVLCNASLSQYLLNDDFIKILEKLKLEGATEQIKNLLNKINNYSNFCGLLIKNFPHQVERQEFKYSEADLSLAEKQTEKILTNAGSIDTKKIKKKMKKNISGIGSFFKKIFKAIVKFFTAIKNKFKKKESKLEDINEVVVINTKNKKMRNSLLIVLGILIIALLVNSLLKKNSENEILIEENVSNFEELIAQKQGKIDSALLYNNKTLANEAILDLKKLLDSMSDKEKNKIKNFAEIENKVNGQIAQMQNIIFINDPEELINFSHSEWQANPQAISLLKSNNKIYAIDTNKKSIYSLNLGNKEVKLLSENDLIKNGALATNEKNNTIYFLVDGQIINIDKQEKLSFKKIKVDNFSQISAFDVYNNRPYLLNKEQKQIYRYEQMSKNEISNYSQWIKDGANINPLYFVTDYHIFILDQGANIYKFLDGKKEDNFVSENIEPALKSADILRVSEKYLYLLDKNDKRLIVYIKDTGKFLNQYHSEKFDNLKDLMIDEAQSKAYVLNGSSIYTIPLSF